MDTKIKEALADVQNSALELHGAVNEAMSRQGEVMQEELQAAGLKARAVAESIRDTLAAQNEAARKHVQLAMTSLDAFQRHAEAALKDTGEAVRSAVTQVQREARAGARQASEGVAEIRAKSP